MCPPIKRMFRVKFRFPILVFVLAGFVSVRAVSGTPLLPDIIMDIQDIQQTTLSNGQKVIRFSTNTVNLGAGPLELHATNAQPDGSSQNVYQWIYDSDGVNHTEHFAGTFAVVGGRLRFLDSADYFLKEVTAGNGVGGIVAAKHKVAYWLFYFFKNTHHTPRTPPNA